MLHYKLRELQFFVILVAMLSLHRLVLLTLLHFIILFALHWQALLRQELLGRGCRAFVCKAFGYLRVKFCHVMKWRL